MLSIWTSLKFCCLVQSLTPIQTKQADFNALPDDKIVALCNLKAFYPNIKCLS